MHGREGVGPAGPPRRVHPGAVAEIGGAPRLVERRPGVHPVAEAGHDQRGVVGVPQRGVADRPAAGVFEFLRQVPVVERRHRAHAALEQAVHQPRVEVQADPVQPPGAAGLYAGPGDGEPVRVQPEVPDDVEIRLVAVIVVVGDVTGVAVERLAWGVAEGVPDRPSAAALVDRALDLVAGGGRPPDEVGGKTAGGCCHCWWLFRVGPVVIGWTVRPAWCRVVSSPTRRRVGPVRSGAAGRRPSSATDWCAGPASADSRRAAPTSSADPR